MKKILFFIICIVCGELSNAQSIMFQWADEMGQGSSPDFGESVTVDALGNVYTTGSFQGTVDFDPGSGVFNLVAVGAGNNIFVSKLDASGNFVWAKNMGGSGATNINGQSIAVDSAGNVYTTGDFNGTVDFDPNAGVVNLVSSGMFDIFISKLDFSGNFVWAENFGGSNNDQGVAITLDASGNVYTTGYFMGTADFDPGPGTDYMSTPGSSTDMFIQKLDTSGNLIWVKSLTTSAGGAEGYAITVDASDNVYITGPFGGTVDFDPGVGVFNMTPAGTGGDNSFVLKLDSLGNFVWAKRFGGAIATVAYSIKLDTLNNIYTTGRFNGTADFDPGSGVYNISSQGGYDMFISKLDSLGNFVWAKDIGGTDDDNGVSIALDLSGNVYTTGFFVGTVDFDPAPGSAMSYLTSGGGGFNDDLFISKLDKDGNYVMAVNIGGDVYDSGSSIALDVSCNVYLTGTCVGTTDFDPGAGVYNLSTPTTNGIFVEKLHQSLTGINESVNAGFINMYPNPNNGVFNIAVSNPINKNYNVEIYNSTGDLIYNKQKITGSITVELGDQAKGIYFVHVIDENKNVINKKIVLQ